MNPFATLVKQYPFLILDGALATELEKRGYDLNDPLWSARLLIEEPTAIQAVHADYFRAGADCVITATYQATFEGFTRRGLSHMEAASLMQRAVSLASDARREVWATQSSTSPAPRPYPLIAASVGPYGAFLANGSEYSGHYGLMLHELQQFHRERLALLAATEADLLAFETIPSLLEAQALVELLHEYPGRTAWVSFSCRNERETCHGESIAECASWLDNEPQIAAIGVNCTAPEYIAPLISAIRPHTSKPIIVYPNSGEVYLAAEHRWTGQSTVSAYASWAQEWCAQGARVIGGCCRTTPAHIAALAALREAATRQDW